MSPHELARYSDFLGNLGEGHTIFDDRVKLRFFLSFDEEKKIENYLKFYEYFTKNNIGGLNYKELPIYELQVIVDRGASGNNYMVIVFNL